MAGYYREVDYHHSEHTHQPVFSTLLAGLASAAGGIIILLLALRFVLSALGVDRLGTVASVVYAASYPFVAPFFALFNYQQQFGVLRFEFQTLIAIVVWAGAAWMLTSLLRFEEED